MKTQKALLKCALALNFCLKLGWSKSELDDLEKIWWSCHDDNGEIKQVLYQHVSQWSSFN